MRESPRTLSHVRFSLGATDLSRSGTVAPRPWIQRPPVSRPPGFPVATHSRALVGRAAASECGRVAESPFSARPLCVAMVLGPRLDCQSCGMGGGCPDFTSHRTAGRSRTSPSCRCTSRGDGTPLSHSSSSKNLSQPQPCRSEMATPQASSSRSSRRSSSWRSSSSTSSPTPCPCSRSGR